MKSIFKGEGFNVRLWLGKQEEIAASGLKVTYGYRRKNNNAEVYKIHFGEKDFVEAEISASTGDFYLDVNSNLLERVDSKIMANLKFATIDAFVQTKNMGKHIYRSGTYKKNGIEIAFFEHNHKKEWYDIMFEGKDPIAARDFIYEIADGQVLPAEDGEDSETAENLKKMVQDLQNRLNEVETQLKTSEGNRLRIIEESINGFSPQIAWYKKLCDLAEEANHKLATQTFDLQEENSRFKDFCAEIKSIIARFAATRFPFIRKNPLVTNINRAFQKL